MEFDNTLSSDVLIYHILSDCDDPVINRHMIAFQTQSNIENENDCIFIAHVSNQYNKQTSDSDHFLANVELIITNRNSDYEIASEAINLCIKQIKKVLRNNTEIQRRQLKIMSSITSYSDDNILNRNLTLQLNEMDMYSLEEDFSDLDVLFSGIELNVQ
ncbi:hypothetical protein [Methanobrevibacter arboriphilus]|uniref:hypothetical protein n=1 Tax=Methanobrevibacter arboriphilus TaxID=39441 RepID=UPI0005B29EF3|nr:hypothetical protein [Methanobrevibacter arboriphilus]